VLFPTLHRSSTIPPRYTSPSSIIMILLNPSLSFPVPPMTGIPPSSAHILSFLFASSYVGSLYLTQTLFAPSRRSLPAKKEDPVVSPEPILASDVNEDPDAAIPGSRDHPHTIKSRMIAVGLASTGSLVGVWWVVRQVGSYTSAAALCHQPSTLTDVDGKR